ncbi:dolichyl-phosphate beta-glucosyltransferase-like [Condylostylus longicornis]|uniref:dolichyl-phosphate beta-glucosyltransferase-like n=1 Tax=Condylostylus longicornis TaxID=2530218 RepID=UPI00244DA6B4|nr:dolichyl-phosphate beta-glucosyltransferase-like [Condylostylus longicornis]
MAPRLDPEGRESLEGSIKWNSDNLDVATLLNQLYEPSSKVSSSKSQPVYLYLSVIIPAYNEAERLPASLPSTIAYLSQRARAGSTFRYEIIIVDDGSSDETGKGFATRIGAQCSRGDYILMADADGATLFSDLGKLETALLCGDHDTQCGFKLFSRKSARSLFPSLHINRWAFDVELIVLASIFNYRIAEIPVDWREIPGSKLQPIAAAVQMARDLVTIRLCYSLGIWKAK